MHILLQSQLIGPAMTPGHQIVQGPHLAWHEKLSLTDYIVSLRNRNWKILTKAASGKSEMRR